ncbi:MAG: hypothetical protein WDO72_08815 [Pseudomonadota bacterium]
MNVQLRELFIAYGVTALAMLSGLLAMRADARAYWRWPVYSAMAMVLGVVAWNQLRAHVLPPQWIATHAYTLYYGALGLYALTGGALGLLLGRLTRGKTPGSAP